MVLCFFKVLPRKDKITKCNYNETTLFIIYIITISRKITLISSTQISLTLYHYPLLHFTMLTLPEKKKRICTLF